MPYTKKIRLLVGIPGISIHKKSVFPKFTEKHKLTNLHPDTPINTTQKQFSYEVVEKYREKIRNGERPVIRAGKDAESNIWLYNGHHRYIAYRLEKVKDIPTNLHEPDAGNGVYIGGEHDAPKFKRKWTRHKKNPKKFGRY